MDLGLTGTIPVQADMVRATTAVDHTAKAGTGSAVRWASATDTEKAPITGRIARGGKGYTMKILIGMAIGVAITLWAMHTPAHAHDAWDNGDPVPGWVKAQCCGPEDVHRLCPVESGTSPRTGNCSAANPRVWEASDGFHIEGYPNVFPKSDVLPSQDGGWWAFYKQYSGFSPSDKSGWSKIYCFFIPFGV